VAFHISYVRALLAAFASHSAAQEHAAHHCIAIRSDHAVNATLVDDAHPHSFGLLISINKKM